MSALPPLRAAATTLLGAVQPVPRPDERLEARYITPNGRCESRFYRSADALASDAARRVSAFHCYYGVALRSGENGSAAGVSRAGATWADIDAKLFALEADPKAAALQAISAFAIPPSVVV